MSGLETAFFRVGGAVVKRAATTWLTSKKTENRRGADMSELIALRFAGLRKHDHNNLRRKLDEVGEIAGERLEEVCAREFSEKLEDNERIAALDAVVDVIDDADLSDTTLFDTDLDPIELAKKVRQQVPNAPSRAGLSEPARALFERALDLCCVQLVHLVRELPEFGSRVSEESLRRATSILSSIEEVLDQLPVASLDAPDGTSHDDPFRHRYRDQRRLSLSANTFGHPRKRRKRISHFLPTFAGNCWQYVGNLSPAPTSHARRQKRASLGRRAR
ncbi:NACHT N-terminal Helical domain 1-containing protein [Saccharopolyspora sp. NPDC002376]